MSKAMELTYIRQIQFELKNYHEKSTDLINCSCPVCGDSKTHKTKARFYFIFDKHKNNYYVICHNCMYTSSFKYFLKEYFPFVYQKYLAELLPNLFSRNKSISDEKVIDKLNNDKTPNIQKLFDKTTLDKYCLPATDVDMAKEFYQQRQLPSEKLKLFYHTDCFGKLRQNLNSKYSEETIVQKMFVIPFYLNNKLIGVQGRNYDKTSDYRYAIAQCENNEHNLIFNRDNINTTKDIFVLEGVFDSLFFDNAIACNGTKFDNEFTSQYKDKVIILPDNEKKNFQTLKNIEKMIEKNYRVWLPSNNLIGKDINEMIQNGISIDSIYEDINDHTYKGLTAKVQFSQWIQL